MRTRPVCPDCSSTSLMYIETVHNFHSLSWSKEWGSQVEGLLDTMEAGEEPVIRCSYCGSDFSWDEVEDHMEETQTEDTEDED
jgi:hypothetical protein